MILTTGRTLACVLTSPSQEKSTKFSRVARKDTLLSSGNDIYTLDSAYRGGWVNSNLLSRRKRS